MLKLIQTSILSLLNNDHHSLKIKVSHVLRRPLNPLPFASLRMLMMRPFSEEFLLMLLLHCVRIHLALSGLRGHVLNSGFSLVQYPKRINLRPSSCNTKETSSDQSPPLHPISLPIPTLLWAVPPCREIRAGYH